MKKFALHFFIGLLFLPALSNAQQKELKVLFVGNSLPMDITCLTLYRLSLQRPLLISLPGNQ